MSKRPEPQSLPSGNFRARVWNRITKERETLRCPYTPEGTWPDRESAQLAIDNRLAEIDGHYVAAGMAPPSRRRVVKFRVFAESWARSVTGIEDNSRHTLLHQIKTLSRWFGDRPIDEITKRHIGEWANDITRKRWVGDKLIEVDGGYAHNTRTNWLSTLRSILDAAKSEGLRQDNPAAEISFTTVREYNARIITADELNTALAEAPWWFKPAILLAHDCGLRRAEIAGLRWHRFINLDDPDSAMVMVADVATERGKLRPYPKGKKPLPVPLTERTRRALLELRAHYPQASDLDRVFKINGTGLVRPATINYYWDQVRDGAGLTDPLVKFHELRHACGNNLADQDAPATVIQAVLRHGNIATSQIYLRMRRPDAARVWMKRVEQGSAAEKEQLPASPVTGTATDQAVDDPGKSVA